MSELQKSEAKEGIAMDVCDQEEISP